MKTGNSSQYGHALVQRIHCTSCLMVVMFHQGCTPRKTNMDTQNDGLEKMIPFKYGHSGYLC